MTAKLFTKTVNLSKCVMLNYITDKQKSNFYILYIRGLPLNLINKELLCVTIQTKITTVDLIANAHTEILVSATAIEKTTTKTQDATVEIMKEENLDKEDAALVASATFSAVLADKN
jgi:hypothetical protein